MFLFGLNIEYNFPFSEPSTDFLLSKEMTFEKVIEEFFHCAVGDHEELKLADIVDRLIKTSYHLNKEKVDKNHDTFKKKVSDKLRKMKGKIVDFENNSWKKWLP